MSSSGFVSSGVTGSGRSGWGTSAGVAAGVVPSGSGGGSDADEARFAALLHRWWLDERPAWCDASWWEATLREEVRRVLWLPAGEQLAAALAALPGGGECPLPHREERMLALPTPGHAPGWPCACQVVVAAAWQACAAWVAAGCARGLVDAAGWEPVEVDVAGGRHQLHDPARDELAAALRWSPTSAGTRIDAARALIAHPRLVALVESAAISAWAGRLVCDHFAGLTLEQAARVVDEVAARVHARLDSGRRAYNSADVNRVARAARMRLYPVPDQEARIRAWAQRRVVVHPQANGMATLIADLADTDAHRIHRRLTSLAAGLESDADADGSPETRTRDQLRADVLTDLLLATSPRPWHHTPQDDIDPRHPSHPQPSGNSSGGSSRPCQPRRPDDGTDTHRGHGRATDTHRGPGDATDPPDQQATATDQDDPTPRPARSTPRPDVQVLVTLDTLLGLTDRPAHVPGLGPIPADTARALAADGRWTALITDAAGAITATGTTNYIPPAAVARLVRAREPHCRFPGCRQPATRCDLDHTTPWPAGTTTPDNLGPLCRRHHQLKTHGGWTLRPHPQHQNDPPPPGWRWTTPAGFTITDHPEPPLP